MNSLPLPPSSQVASALRSMRDGLAKQGSEESAIVQRLIQAFERNDPDAAILTEKVL